MNGLGVGIAVGLGAVISLLIVAPGAEMIEFVATGLFYGCVSGMIFALYRWAFSATEPPFRPGGRR